MMSGGAGGSNGLRYYLWKSAQKEVENQKDALMMALGLDESEARRRAMKQVPNPRVIHDEFGLVHDGYEPTGPEDGYRLADRLRDELEMSQELSNRNFEYLYQADWMAAHPGEADELSDEDWKGLVEDYLEKMGWEDHRYMIVAHDHTDHRDRHVIIDRYDPETDQTLDMSWVVNNRRDAQRELEQEHGLQEVDPRNRPRIGHSTEHLRQRMANRNEYEELEQFVQNKAEGGTIESRGDVKEIIKEAQLDIVKDKGDYITVDFEGSRHRIGTDDVPAVDWENAQVEAYRRAATDLRPVEIAQKEQEQNQDQEDSFNFFDDLEGDLEDRDRSESSIDWSDPETYPEASSGSAGISKSDFNSMYEEELNDQEDEDDEDDDDDAIEIEF